METSFSPLNTQDNALLSQLRRYPSFLDLDCKYVTGRRLQELLNNIKEEDDEDDVCPEETIYKLNFKSWVHKILGQKDEAKNVNTQVILKTGEQNIISISSRAILSLEDGEDDRTKQYIRQLENLKKDVKYETVAKAELAYAYERMGGAHNLSKAIHILEDALKLIPQNFFWKLRLGNIYGKATYIDILSLLSNDMSATDYLLKAVKQLTEVSTCTVFSFRGPAFAELAALYNRAYFIVSPSERDEIFANESCEDFCNKALNYSKSNPWVLTACGRALRRSDVDMAILLLNLAAHLRPRTTVFYQLGLCYRNKAKRLLFELKKEESKDLRSELKGQILFDLTKKAFEKAVERSFSANAQPIFDLGMFYKNRGDIQNALKKFNQIINSALFSERNTVILAYEQAGLCYRELKQWDDAEQKLLKAFSLNVSLLRNSPELRKFAKSMWKSSRILKNQLKQNKASTENDKKLINLLQLMEDHREVVEIMMKHIRLSEENLDPDIIKSGLESYLDMGKFENALAFLNLAYTTPAAINSRSWNTPEMLELKTKVLFYTAKDRIQKKSGDACVIFQELFNIHYPTCSDYLSDTTTNEQKDFSGDILFVYDDSNDSTTQAVCKLQQIFNSLFGLDTNKNLEGSAMFGPKFEIQLQVMAKHRLVILVLGDDQSSEFGGLMKIVPHAACDMTCKIQILDMRRSSDAVMPVLKQYQYTKFEDIVQLQDNLRESEDAAGSDPQVDIVRDIFKDNAEAVLSLFCFILGKTWPLS